ncbi:MAG: CHAT domain-containing protein [Dysgonamonadaceae bacterium]|jgi:CHAT domain-containing protein|nr:CHAT domain-containing protein [Dysgonamonadaceae bacterium]
MKKILLIGLLLLSAFIMQAQLIEIKKGEELYLKGKYSEAEATFKQIIERYENRDLIEAGDYASALTGLANVYSMKTMTEKADSLFSEACKIIKDDENLRLEYAIILTYWAIHRIQYSRLDNLEDWLNTALKITEEKAGKQSIEYIRSLSTLGILYTWNGNTEKAIDLLTESKTICDNLIKRDDHLYGQILTYIGHCYFMTQNMEKAEEYCSQARNILFKTLGDEHLDYISAQLSLALVYSYRSRFQESIDLILPVIPVILNSIGKENQLYISAVSSLGGNYMMLNEHKEAEIYLLATMEVAAKKFGETSQYYFSALNSLANLYSVQGLYEKAENLYIKSIELRKILYGEQHLSVVRALSNLGILYYDMNIYENAEKYLKEAMQISENAGYQHSIEYANILGNMANLSANKNQENTLSLYEQAEQIFKENHAEDHPSFFSLISNKLQYIANDSTMSYDSVESMYLENMRQKIEKFGEHSIQTLTSFAALGDFYYEHKDYEKAEIYYNRFITNAAPFAAGILYPKILYSMGCTQELRLNRARACEYFLRSFNQFKDNIRKNFAFLSKTEREMLWENTVVFLNCFREIAIYEWENGNDSIAEFAYNNELLSKNILLSVTQNINEAVTNGNDPELSELWKNLSILKNIIIKNESNQLASSEEMEKLLAQSQEMEKQLLHKLQPYQNLQNLFNRTWKDIQKKLSNKEAAIEFSVIYPNDFASDTIYYALLLRPNYKYPQIIELCKESDLKTAIKQSPYDGKNVYPLIWKPIEKYLNGVSEIFLSPSGLLHGVSFTGMETGKGYLGEAYDLHQLLSTKDIAEEKSKNTKETSRKHIALFGGADYGLSPAEMVLLDEDLKKDYSFQLTRGMLDYMDSTRGQGFDYLPGSVKEVQSIAGQLSEKDWNISIFIDKEATETRFKSFSSWQSPEILHVSTHGFYFPPAKNVDFFNEMGNNRFRLSDNPLMRSGLAFTGANQTWSGKQLPENNADDGILTSYEVSNLNLSNTELVVLSACETGLGDIVGSEGVYGMQRAFRLAGAKSILVSLWKVPDKETRELMTEFYVQLSHGNSFYQSFSTARRKMRTAYPEQPEKWAGFVFIE